MKDRYNNIDELLKQSLEGYQKEPSAGVWKKISARLLLSGRGLYFIIAALILAVLSGSLIFQNSSNSKGDVIVVKNESSVVEPVENKLVVEQKNIEKTIESEINIQTTNNSSNEIISQVYQEKEIGVVSQERTLVTEETGTDILVNSEKVLIHESIITNNKENNSYNKYPGLETLDSKKSFEPNFFTGFYLSSVKASNIYPRSSYHNIPTIMKDDYGRRGTWSYGLHLTPEVIFTNDENNSKKTAISLDVTGIYSVKDWVLEFGVGVGFSEDDGNYQIDYAQYDSIGYYYKVTGFVINPENGQPIYNTNVEGVYDTVLYNETQTTDNLYTYLRIPVFGGLKIHENKRLSVSLKAGGIYSILINKKEPGSDYTNESATWISISNETQERIQSNIQLSLAVGLSYQLSNKLSINMEPFYNYYIQPVYERKLNSKSPWSVGLRAGIELQF